MKHAWGFFTMLLFSTLSCVDKAEITLATQSLPVIIEATITDEPSPDTVKITKAYPADGGFYSRVGISGATVRIVSNAGESDQLTDIGRGFYVTDTLQGTIGRTYQLFITLKDGSGEQHYQSTTQRMLPAGEIENITFEFTSSVNSSSGITEDGFNVFVDSKVEASSTRRLRYKVFGTYKIQTDPSLIEIRSDCPAAPCPTTTLPCAEACECCICWASEHETAPILVDPKFVGGTSISHRLVHYVPINNFTLQDRYRVEITQLELSQDAYDFYAAIRKQIENAASLFQPPFFELQGNIRPVGTAPKVVGIFSAAAVTRKHIYIYRSDVPYDLISEPIPGDCRSAALNSTNQKPSFWE